MTNASLKRLGKRLSNARIARNLTQEQVAERAGITANYYSMIERGLKNPSVTVIKSIAAAIGLKTSDIVDD